MLVRLPQHINVESDGDLLARFRQGDHSAFTALVARHGAMVYNVCRRQFGNAHAAEDAFQAVFLVLARKAEPLRGSLAAWLHGIAVRICLNARRASRRRREEPLPEVCDDCPDPLSRLSARELLQALEEEVQRLPQAYRLAVVLCCFEGLSQEEAAQRLGWTAGSVKGRLERGRARLRELLTRRGLAPAAVLAALTRSELSAALAVKTVNIALSQEATGEVLRLAQHVLKGATVFKKLALAAALLIGVSAIFGEDKKDVAVDLKDGSRVVGKADGPKELRLKASFGEVRIPVEQVASVQFKDDQGTVVVKFHNGDQVTGTLDLKALGGLKVSTALGETTVPFNLVTVWKLDAPPGRAKVTARASSTGEQTDPNNPFLPDKGSWNSGGYSPAWLEADLGSVRKLDRITLVTSQAPKGDTVHEIWVSDEPIGNDTAKAKLVHTFKGETDTSQELKLAFDKGLTARYVQIRTTESPSWVAWERVDLQVR